LCERVFRSCSCQLICRFITNNTLMTWHPYKLNSVMFTLLTSSTMKFLTTHVVWFFLKRGQPENIFECMYRPFETVFTSWVFRREEQVFKKVLIFGIVIYLFFPHFAASFGETRWTWCVWPVQSSSSAFMWEV
jgi:hypothetical protein